MIFSPKTFNKVENKQNLSFLPSTEVKVSHSGAVLLSLKAASDLKNKKITIYSKEIKISCQI